MKERPILFSAPMVRAILAGTKSQTRRVVKPVPSTLVDGFYLPFKDEPNNWHGFGGDLIHWYRSCPYGQPGDRLWVREAWRVEGKHTDSYSPTDIGANRSHFGRIDYEASITWNKSMYGKLRPGIHMPRWASRITLEVTGVRVERLNSISEADALAEGTPCYVCGGPMNGLSEADCHCFHNKAKPSDYRALWESINIPGSWDANPWVWCVEFKRLEAGG